MVYIKVMNASDLSSFLYADEKSCVEGLLAALSWDADISTVAGQRAAAVVERVRAAPREPGELESFLREYSLDTGEGLALMALAEALLRIPDSRTAQALIRDKVLAADWLEHKSAARDWLMKTAGLGLRLSRKTLDGALAKIGEPFIRESMLKAMRLLGRQFVLGDTIENAFKNGEAFRARGYAISYDMLGEGARSAEDAERYFRRYLEAILYAAKNSGDTDRDIPPAVSVKLSALHPRYEFAQKDRCVPQIAEKLLELCRAAADAGLQLTIDAEECERLELSLEIFENLLADESTAHWSGLGLAVQAYQKKALPLIDRLAESARAKSRRIHVRLVKGAYWDSEIKRAQILGLADYPVFTRKANTDVSFLACAQKLLAHGDVVAAKIGTHNAHSAAAIIETARRENASFELQRLHGMGQAVFACLMEDEPGIPCSIYAPVGDYRTLLPYLVRRLLENGANSSFVNRLLDPDEPVRALVEDPVEKVRGHTIHHHPEIPQPCDLYGEARRNSKGLDLTDPSCAAGLLPHIQAVKGPYKAYPFISGVNYRETVPDYVHSPADINVTVGHAWSATMDLINQAFDVADHGFKIWSNKTAEERASVLEALAESFEEHRAELMGLCVREGGRTVADALAEVREAVDFCRYYAMRGRADFAESGNALPGPTGESNRLYLQGRGTFVCISPWNFPLAIFTGQVTAALMAGNAVIAKPAEQTPLIAMRAVQLMHEAGVPHYALSLLPGDGEVGAAIVDHPKTAGVAFTGSVETAHAINRALAAKDGPVTPVIAETGGMNAMFADSSALPEQLVDDVIHSAFGSAGQRCSALRILYLPEETADEVIAMLAGAMRELRLGDPADLATDIGPLIDEEAHAALMHHRQALEGYAKLIYEVPLDDALHRKGHFFAPCAFELRNLLGLDREVFGPVLHVVRYEPGALDEMIDELNAKGYGLTLGVHSRIRSFYEKIAARVRAGNVYVNRTMTGAVVGVQPFGGRGLSGTGPKAGGPHYLPAFAAEKSVSIDTTASGGNASLVSLEE